MSRAKEISKKNALRARRKRRIRGDISGTAEMPRVSIFKSNKHLYAQAIDDVTGVTVASVDGKKLGFGKNIDSAEKVAAAFAETLKANKIENVVFDRNGYLYHGVVAKFAETLRSNGIKL